MHEKYSYKLFINAVSMRDLTLWHLLKQYSRRTVPLRGNHATVYQFFCFIFFLVTDTLNLIFQL